MFTIELRKSARGKWQPMRYGNFTFANVDAAIERVCSYDIDGMFDHAQYRIVDTRTRAVVDVPRNTQHVPL